MRSRAVEFAAALVAAAAAAAAVVFESPAVFTVELNKFGRERFSLEPRDVNEANNYSHESYFPSNGVRFGASFQESVFLHGTFSTLTDSTTKHPSCDEKEK